VDSDVSHRKGALASNLGSLTDRFGGVDPRWLGGLALACIATGLLAGINPGYGLLAAAGIMFAAIVIRDLTLGFVLFTGLTFLDVLSSTGSFSATKVIGLVLFVSWLARVTTRRTASLAAENPGLVVALVAMLGWVTLSFTWAASSSTALNGALRLALEMLLLPIAFAAVRTREHVTWVIAAFVIGALVSSVYGFVHPTAQTNQDFGRLTGLNGDANGEATVLSAAIPLLIGMMGTVMRSPRWRAAALIGLAVLFAGLVNTLSREGLLSLAVAMIVGVIFGGRWRRRAAMLLVIGVTATVGYYFVLAPLSARHRVTMSDTSGRSSIWKVAGRVIAAHPLLGVGQDNFTLVEHNYINRPGAITYAQYIINTPKLTHNTYLEALTDTGIPGLLALLAVLGCSIGAAVRATWIFERLGDRDMELISRTVVLAVVAVLTSDFFVASVYAKYLWILLALCPVLLGIARRAAAPRDLGASAAVLR
jgi:O-antigen ligase